MAKNNLISQYMVSMQSTQLKADAILANPNDVGLLHQLLHHQFQPLL